MQHKSFPVFDCDAHVVETPDLRRTMISRRGPAKKRMVVAHRPSSAAR
jgi:hypothetical protein